MDYVEIEDFVFENDAETISNLYSISEGKEKQDWEMGIMTAISIGDRQDLEEKFPEFAGTNQENSNLI